MSKGKNYEVRSDEVNDILSRPPAWLVRSGSVMFLGIVVLFLTLSAIMKYPDIIKAPVVLSSRNMPISVVAKKTGRLERVFKENNSVVQKGDAIALLENTAEFEDYLVMSGMLESFSLKSMMLQDTLSLGEMQGAYSNFVRSNNEYMTFLELDFHGKMALSLKQEIDVKQDQLLLAKKREEIAAGRYNLATKQVERERELFAERAISQQEMDRAEEVMLQSTAQMESAREEIVRVKGELLQANQELLKVEMDKEESRTRMERACDSDLAILTAAIKAWEESYLLVAPDDGSVVFTSYWQENQNVLAGETVFTILPQEKEIVTAKIFIPLAGAGKVASGQKVNIKLDSYPYMEYGVIETVVKSVSPIPANVGGQKVYIVTLDFPSVVRTTYSHQLELGQEMHGIAEIITQDISLLKRVVSPLRYLFGKYS